MCMFFILTLLVDGAAAYLMQQGKVQWLIVGSDRIAANGDVSLESRSAQHATVDRKVHVQILDLEQCGHEGSVPAAQ